MKKAAVYSPYFDTLGGGEKYTAAATLSFLKLGVTVDILWHDLSLLEQIRKRYEYDLSPARIFPVGKKVIEQGSLLEKYQLLRNYDYCFFVSDGSIPALFAKQNILHFQVPFKGVRGTSFTNQLKLKTIDDVVVNSRFTKRVIDGEYRTESVVVYPPATMISSGEKEKMILSVGRFDNLMQSKRQDVLIKAFKQLNQNDWRLVLVGGMLHGKKKVEELKRLMGDAKNMELIINPSWNELEQLFASASIFWHAAGYGADERKHPEQVEHFGIATVEAMSAGAVPVVYKGGGQKEIVKQEENGFLWKEPSKLVDYTSTIINNEKKRTALSRKARQSSQQFSTENFIHAFQTILS